MHDLCQWVIVIQKRLRRGHECSVYHERLPDLGETLGEDVGQVVNGGEDVS